MTANNDMRIRLCQLPVVALMSIFSSSVHAGLYCVSVDKLPPPADEAKHSIETYLLGRYQADHFVIGRLGRDFYLAWPDTENCKRCVYHLIRQRGQDSIEFMAFNGGGAILFSDMIGEPDRILRDNYEYFWLKQQNKSYLFVGIPASQGVPYVEAPSLEHDGRLPPCDISSR
jgi:hypothetical protein